MDYANKSVYRSEGSRVALGTVLMLFFVIGAAWFISTNAVRGLSGQPMLHEKALVYKWKDKKVKEKDHCIVAIKGEPARECGKFTPEKLNELRLQRTVPTQAVLLGDFDL